MSQTRSLPSTGVEPGRQVVALGVAGVLTVVVVNVLLVGELSLFFDLCFVVLCLALALAVRVSDFFTVGVLPPLMMLGTFVVLALVAPDTIAERRDGVVQATVSGLAHHSGALVSGYALCLATLGIRTRTARGPRLRA